MVEGVKYTGDKIAEKAMSADLSETKNVSMQVLSYVTLGW